MIMALHSSSSLFSVIFPYPSCLPVFLILTIFCLTSVSSSKIPEIPYSDHCSSDVSESTPTQRVHHSDILPYLFTVSSYFHGGDSLWTRKSLGQLSNTSSNSLTFQPTQKSAYRTEEPGIFKLKAYLTLRPSYVEDDSYRYSRYGSYGWSYYASGNYSEPRQLQFLLNGYFSESSGKLCMVGSALWYSKEGKPEYVEAVLRLTFAEKNSNISSSFVNGSLQSLSSIKDTRYFEAIKILAFTDVESYKYSLASKDLGAVCKGGVITQPSQSLNMSMRRSRNFCYAIMRNYGSFELEHARDCNPSKKCSPVDGVLGYSPRYMSLNVIQCSDEERKVRYMVKFQNASYVDYYRGFNPNTTFVGEGSWDDSKNQLCVVACRILNLPGDAHVGDCSLRLSLRFPAVWTIRDNSRAVGELWTNKTAQDSGYLQMMKFRNTDHDINGYYSLPGPNYKYTETERIRKQCPSPKVAMKEEKYPDGNSRDMSFDISVQYSKQQFPAWGAATPIFAGDEPFEPYSYVQTIDSYGVETSVAEESSEKPNSSIPLKMSYLINFEASYFNFTKEFASLNLSLNSRGKVEIIAEGIYHGKTGHLCMVGCRKLELETQKSEQDSQDCEILVQFDFPSVNARRRNLIKGSIRSTRQASHPLYFAQLNITSNAYYTRYARESIWRMDLEIIMVLISNTLACVFIGLQLLYAKRHAEMLPFMSLVMLAVLTLGHMIPLVLNFEALFLGSRQRRQRSMFGADGWIEVNEVIVRVVTMVAFLLQARLLQLAWSAKWETGNGKGLWLSERKTVFVSFPLYIAGGLLTILVKWMCRKNMAGTTYSSPDYYYSSYQDNNPQSSTWGGLRSYAGFILDGFLFPQVLFNIFHSSKEDALSRWFYIGTTLVRLLPHAYDLYRVHNYATMEVEGSYLYANPRADFYSTAWDIIIPCVGMVLAVIIWLQQRFGGRCVLPRRFRDSVAYEKVPDDSSA